MLALLIYYYHYVQCNTVTLFTIYLLFWLILLGFISILPWCLFFYYTCMVFYHNWQPFWGFLFIIQNNHVVQRQVHATKLFFWAIIAEGRGSRPARGISRLHWTLHHSLMQLSRFMLTMVEIWLGLLWVYHLAYIVSINERSVAKFLDHS